MSEFSGPRGSVTLMFTDIEGSTKLLERLRDGYAQILETHRHLLRDLFEKHNGWEVDTQGDSFFVAFGSALDAVLCAADIQRALAAERWPEGARVRVRIGLHTGAPVLGPTGYVGVDVHRGARVGAAAHGGQVLASREVRDALGEEMPEGVSLVEVGVFRFKGLNEPTTVLQVHAPGLETDFPEVRVSAPEDEPPVEGEAPYKGLLAFEAEDAERFFGREELVAEVLHEIEQGNFLAIVGASGSGKSSVVRAGVIPALRARPGSRTLVMTPTAHPWEALGAALDAFADGAVLAALADGAEPTTLVVDQFEELFTLSRDENERRDFAVGLAAHARGSLHVLITLRADFYAGVAEFPALRDLVAEHQRYIGPMSVDELRRAIIEPAKRGGWDVAPGLVDLLLRDVGNEPGALPLLSHALLETWRRRRGSRMTLKGYFEAGEVRGAIARTADRLYGELVPAQQEAAREILLRLTELGEGTQDTRRRAALDELVPRDVLQRLVEARLVTIDEGAAEVAHEALIREWPRLREWLQEDREGLRVQRQITEAAAEWHSLNQERSLLFRGARLAAAREWAQSHAKALNDREATFVAASVADEERDARERAEQQAEALHAAERAAAAERRRADDQAASNKRLRRRAWILVGAMAIAAGLGVVAVVFANQANDQAAIAATQAQNALDAQQLAEQRQTEAETQQQIAQSRQLAAEALNKRSDLGLSLLLSVEAYKSADTVEAISSLFSGLQTEPRIVTTLPAGLGAFAPHSRIAAGFTPDQTIGLWDVGARRQLSEITLPDYWLGVGLAFDPSGAILAAGHLGGEVQLFDVATRQPLGPPIVGNLDGSGAAGPVTRILFAPDGKTFWANFIPATENFAVTHWDVSTQQQIGEGLDFDAPVTRMDLSPDGSLLAVAVRYAGVVIVSAEDGAPVATLGGNTVQFSDVRFSPDGSTLAATDSETVIDLFDADTFDLINELPIDSVDKSGCSGITFDRTGSIIACAFSDGQIGLWDPATGEQIGSPLLGVAGGDLMFDPVTDQPVSRGATGTLLWDLDARGRISTLGPDLGPTVAVTFSSDGSRIAITRTNDQYFDDLDAPDIVVLDATTLDPIAKLRQLPGPDGGVGQIIKLGFNSDGTSLTGAGYWGAARWDLGTDQITAGPVFFNVYPDADIAADRTTIVAATSATITTTNDIEIWDLLTSGPVATIHTEIDFDPTAAIGLRVAKVAVSPDGLAVAAGFTDGSTRIYDLATGSVRATFLTDPDSEISALAFSRDGSVLAMADGYTIFLRDMATGDAIGTPLRGQFDLINSLTFSPDGAFLVAGTFEHAVLWRVADERQIATLPGATAGAFSPDGNTLITVGERVEIWDMRINSWLSAACHLAGRSLTQEEWSLYLPDEDYQATCA